ncbi:MULTISPECIES: 4-hydroxybenzoate 3-monooxygenase [Kitasatospora]|uniref:Putative p-hydroxybenzoate hydroxylase n=1 Tax=Kitasatospora setae (strain ATCC 33774 / DSM 43861 / JCM 3304 / KCC A-0304 / NBRC 14216 / KM-6054) TaxID=452652 RepID=E4NJX4_KITSK|nr:MULTISPECIES: 4-hydroxybenzoate 3-monooxygenase [Kitasatospora]BAJ33272.1 putative p-hydroxybenzoate hydroxylase [Kitasatospora setae KM-6054]
MPRSAVDPAEVGPAEVGGAAVDPAAVGAAEVDTVTEVPVAVVGAGPAGLMLAHLLGRAGVDAVAVDLRSRAEIESTHRAGILEADAARDLVETGVSDRILREGHEHEGTELRFGGRAHRIDFRALVGASVWLYPQTEVFTDLADARARDGGTVHFGVSDPEVLDADTDRPRVRFTAADGTRHELRARYVVGADGSRGMCRGLVPEELRVRHGTEYPFAWFGVMAQAPASAPELVYAHSEHGFALISRRTETVQRMYFQCDPDEDTAAWPDERIWATLQARVAGGDGFRLVEGPILERTVLRFRSFVQEPMRWGSLLLAGDAAHTVPPTGARGLNLALHDVKVLAGVLLRALGREGEPALADYQPLALRRIWRAQHFSSWMTRLLHTAPGASPFELRRQLGELDSVVGTRAGRAYLAEQYTGWPSSR